MLLLWALILIFISSAHSWNDGKANMCFNNTFNALDTLCWFEHLKNFHNLHSSNKTADSFRSCSSDVSYIRSYTANKTGRCSKAIHIVGEYIKASTMKHFPPQYKSNCSKFLDDDEADTVTDESDTLNDGGKGYPYKQFCYCLFNTVRKIHGDKAIRAIKAEKTHPHPKKELFQAVLDRMNEMRAYHRVEPLQMSDELKVEAQAFAEKSARHCSYFRCKNISVPVTLNRNGKLIRTDGSKKGQAGKATVVYDFFEGSEKEMVERLSNEGGYVFPNELYRTGKHYAYLEEKATLCKFDDVRDFTQLIWKGSKYVGYGLARNQAESCGAYFFVAVYFPNGNIEGRFKENVFPPKN